MAKEDVKLIIGADGKKAIKELQEVTQHMGKFGSSVNSLLDTATGFMNWQTAAVAGFTAVATGIGVALKKQIDYADQMANMSKRTGIAVESLSKLAYVAQQSDTSTETLQKSMKFLNTALYDVSKGNTSAIEKFKEFGIQVYNADGTVKNAEQALIAAADAYTKLDSEAAKTTLATEIFGKAGQELMPMLSEGSAGIMALTDEAKKLGLEIDSTTANAAERFNDNLDKLAAFGKGAVNVLMEELTPAIEGFSNAVDNSDLSVESWTTRIRKAFEFITDLAKFTTPGLGVGNTILKEDPTGNWIPGDQADKAWQEYYSKQGAGVPLTFNQGTGMMVLDTKYNPFAGLPTTPTNKNYSGGTGGAGSGSGSKGGATDYFSRTRPMQDNYSGFGLANQWISDLTYQANAQSAYVYSDDIMMVPLMENVLPAQLEFIDQSQSAWDVYFKDVQMNFADNMAVMGDIYGDALGGFSSMFEAFANSTGEQYGVIFEASRAFRAAEIVASTWTAAQKAYEFGIAFGPWTAGIMMASAIATGVGNLTNLYATKPGAANINGASAAPTPNFASRNPQGGDTGAGNKTIIIKYEGLIYGDKDKIARDLYDAFAKAGRDGMGR